MQPTPQKPSPDVAAQAVAAEPGASVGVFLALLAALISFSYASTPLLRYPDRAIGVGLMGGVDPARRFPIYLALVAVVLGVWLGCHYAARALRQRRPSWFLGARSRLENDVCALFAGVGSVAVVARVSADRLDRLGPTFMCLAGVGVVLAFALARRLTPRPREWRQQFGSLNLLAVVVLLSWPASQISGVLANADAERGAGLVRLGTVLLPFAFALGLVLCLRRPGRAARADVRRAFVVGAAPYFLFPSLCPVANELQHALAQRRVLEPRSLALGLLCLLAATSAFLFWRARAGRLGWAPARVLARFVYPSIIFGEALLSVYHSVLTSKHVDALHDGEQITAVQQLLSFDKWPFIDIWPAHGLFDYLGALYALVNGFHPLEITAWNGLLAALSATAVYAVLAQLGTPLFGFAVAALLPIEVILPLPTHSFFHAEPGLLGVGLLACLVLAKPSTGRYALLSLATFSCFFWTPTSGVAAIVAIFAVLVLGVITASDRRPAWRALAVFVAAGAGVFGAYVLVLVLRGQPLFETLGLIRAFMQADPLIGGRTTVLEQFDGTAFVQYVLLPGIGLLYLGQLARHAIDRRPLGHVDRLLCFLTLTSFVLFARTLTRHGLIERFQGFYFPLLALALGMPRKNGMPFVPLATNAGADERRGELGAHFWQRASARAWFFGGLALYLVWRPQPSHKHLVFDAFSFRTWKSEESRFQGPAPNYPRVRTLLGSMLGPKDTFLELMNMPLLYAMLEREVPGQFFLPTMFYATDSVQNSFVARLEAFGGSARVPIVFLPGDKGQNIDNIENTLRSYRIAEHVYRNYVPFGRMDGFDTWVSRARWEEAARTSSPRPLVFLSASSYRSYSVNPPELDAGVLRVTATGTDPRVEGVVDVEGIPFGGIASHHAVRLSYRTSVAGKLELFYRFGSNYGAADSGRAMLVKSVGDEWQSAEIPIPPQADPRLRMRALRIDPPDGATLEVKDPTLVFGQAVPLEPSRDQAGMLPFFWGNFDDHRAAEVAHVLEAIDVPGEKRALASFRLKLRPVDDHRTGHYLKLCIRLPGLDAPAKRGAWTTVHHGGSWQSAGKVTLSYGASPSASFVFDLVRPTPGVPGLPRALERSFGEECKPYLVRLSAQYAWSSQPVSSINVASSVPILLESVSLLAGD